MIMAALALLGAFVADYKSSSISTYDSECGFVGEASTKDWPKGDKVVLLPPIATCNRPSIMVNGQRKWLDASALKLGGLPVCAKVSDPASERRAGTEMGSSPGGAMCIPTPQR